MEQWGSGSRATGRRWRIGGVISEMFAAGSDSEATGHLDRGPFVDGLAEAVAVGELTSLEFDTLQSVLTGASFREVLESGEGGLVEARSDTGPWVSRVRPRLTQAMAEVNGAHVDQIARRWAARDEVEDISAETLAVILRPLSELARTVDERGLHLYLWNSL